MALDTRSGRVDHASVPKRSLFLIKVWRRARTPLGVDDCPPVAAPPLAAGGQCPLPENAMGMSPERVAHPLNGKSLNSLPVPDRSQHPPG